MAGRFGADCPMSDAGGFPAGTKTTAEPPLAAASLPPPVEFDRRDGGGADGDGAVLAAAPSAPGLDALGGALEEDVPGTVLPDGTRGTGGGAPPDASDAPCAPDDADCGMVGGTPPGVAMPAGGMPACGRGASVVVVVVSAVVDSNTCALVTSGRLKTIPTTTRCNGFIEFPWSHRLRLVAQGACQAAAWAIGCMTAGSQPV